MRVAVDIPDAMYRQLKSGARRSGYTVQQLVLRVIEAELSNARVATPKKKKRIKLPLVESKHPGWLKLDNKKIQEILFP